MSYAIQVYRDVAEFKADALPFLRANARQFNQLLVSCERLTAEAFSRHGYWLACLRQDGNVSAVCCSTSPPPHRLISVSVWPGPASADLKDALAGFAANALIGPAGSVEFLAGVLGFRQQCRHVINYVLTNGPQASVAEGHPRPAGPDDTPMLAEWFTEFEIECKLPRSSHPELLNGLEQDLLPGSGRCSCLWIADGRPVAVGRLAVVGGVARIGPVYTPPPHRSKGYAGALVARLAGAAFEQGATIVCLYADAANAVSNALYRRVGFEAIGEFKQYE